MIANHGHADGHLAFMLQSNQRRCLFISDLLCGRRVLQATYDYRPQMVAQSLLRLADQQVECLLY